MIFVTVGTQMSFDRLVKAMDRWAESHADHAVFAQIGPRAWPPRRMRWSAFLAPEEYRQRVEEARLVVSHAGIGSILSALELGKPIVVVPRRHELGEHINNHQVDTAEMFRKTRALPVAYDEQELYRCLESREALKAGGAARGGDYSMLLEEVAKWLAS